MRAFLQVGGRSHILIGTTQPVLAINHVFRRPLPQTTLTHQAWPVTLTEALSEKKKRCVMSWALEQSATVAHVVAVDFQTKKRRSGARMEKKKKRRSATAEANSKVHPLSGNGTPRDGCPSTVNGTDASVSPSANGRARASGTTTAAPYKICAKRPHPADDSKTMRPRNWPTRPPARCSRNLPHAPRARQPRTVSPVVTARHLLYRAV